MAKKWSDVAASSAFQALSLDEQEDARQQYFDEIVAPQVSDGDLASVREMFDIDTRRPAAPGDKIPAGGDKDLLSEVYADYPGLAKYGFQFRDSPGRGGNRKLEFYPPGESRSPFEDKGKPGIERFDSSMGKMDVFGEMLHFLPGADRRVGEIRNDFQGSITSEQKEKWLRGDYEQQVRNKLFGDSPPTFDQWLSRQGGDAFFRGYLTRQYPAEAYTPEQIGMLNRLDSYLREAQPAGSPLKRTAEKNRSVGEIAESLPQSDSPGVVRSLSPLNDATRARIRARYDAASPKERQVMAAQPGAIGQYAKELEGRYAKIDQDLPLGPTGRAADAIDSRREARQRQLMTNEGMAADAADNLAKVSAKHQIPVGAETPGGQVSETDFDFDRARDWRENPMLDNPVARGVVKGATGFARGAAGVGEAISTATGIGTPSDLGQRLSQFDAEVGESKDTGSRNFENAVASIVQQVPGLATGSTGLALASMGLTSFGQEYNTGVNSDLSPDQAAARAGAFAAFEIIGEKFGLGPLLSRIKAAGRGIGDPGELAGFFLSQLKKEIPGELLTTTGQFAVDKLPEIGLNQGATLDDYFDQVKDTVTQTVMQGGLMYGGTTGVAQAARAHSSSNANLHADAAQRAATEKWATEGLLAGQRPDAALPPVPKAAGGGGGTNFTPADSLSTQLGLTPVVVPDAVPMQAAPPVAAAPAATEVAQAAKAFGFDKLQEQQNVSAGNPNQPVPGAGDPSAGHDATGGVAAPGSVPAGGQSGVPASAAPVGTRQEAVAVRGGTPEPASPVETWVGRRGDGYVTEGDAQQALPGRQKRNPGLSWRIEQMPSGKYRLAGYAAEQAQEAAPSKISGPPEIDNRERQPALGAGKMPVPPEIARKEKSAPRGEWVAFPPASGTRGIPRADMPQIKAEHRGALVNFLAARGITHEQQDVPAADLKATQAEFSPAKVDKAKGFTGGDRSILVSSDGHVVDGHHQWVAKLDDGASVKVIRLDAPIDTLLPMVREFPSATSAEGGSSGEARGIAGNRTGSGAGVLDSRRQADPEVRGTTNAAEGLGTQNSALHDRGAGFPVRPAGAQPGQRLGGLRLAPTAPLSKLDELRRHILRETGSEISQVQPGDINEGEQVASAVARMFNKTLTVVEGEGLPFNGVTDRLGGQHILLAHDTEDAPLSVAVHEIYHGLPDGKRKTLNKAILELTHQDQHAYFAKRFNYTDAEVTEELPAYIVQALSKQPDFWQQVRQKMGNHEFAEVAKIILAKLDDIIRGFRDANGDEFLKRYVKDVVRARDLLSTAYADAVREGTESTQSGADLAPARRNGKVTKGVSVPKGEVDRGATATDRGGDQAAERDRQADQGRKPGAVRVPQEPAAGRGHGDVAGGTARSNRSRDEEQSRPYTRRGGRDGGSLRVLGVNALAEFSPSDALRAKLAAQGAAAPSLYELGGEGASLFHDAIAASKDGNKFGAAVYVYPEEEYRDMRLFLAKDARAGFALKGDDIVSVFSLAPHKGSALGMLDLAVQEGGRRLDAFNTVLPEIYARNRFKIVARIKWNDEYQPDGWDKAIFERWSNGEPDVVFMVHDPEYAGSPSNDDGVLADNYDDAIAEQRKAIDEIYGTESGPVFDQRDAAPVFYSALTRAAETAKIDKGTAPQWLGTLRNSRGVKEEELQWAGLGDWLLKLGGSATKQQVVDYLRANELQVEEVLKGDASRRSEDVLRHDELVVQMTAKGYSPENDSEDGWLRAVDSNDGTRRWIRGRDGVLKEEDGSRLPPEIEKMAEEIHGLRQSIEDDASESTVKYQDYTTPGGSNYRELLLTLPRREVTTGDVSMRLFGKPMAHLSEDERQQVSDEMRRAFDDRQKDYRSSHWDEPNVLAHVRFDERYAEGRRVLHIAEVQSDWHQEGRKRGYRSSTPVTISKIERGESSYRVSFTDGSASEVGKGTIGSNATDEEVRAYYRNTLTEKNSRDSRVPDAPFKTTWSELVFKRMIRFAADNGFDRITWDTGETNTARYDLSKQVTAIRLEGDFDQSIEVSVVPPGNRGFRHIASTTKDKLADVVGKEIADKALNEGQREFRGLDLKVGGEGMRAFYDKILPSTVNKLVKKWGGRVGSVRIDDEAVHSLDITDAMLDAALAGQPMFNKREQVETPEFKRWFGDSKVVERKTSSRDRSTGRPLVVYHGTPGNGFTRFEPRKGTTTFIGIPVEVQRYGYYFAEDREFAEQFANQGEARSGNVIPAYLSIQNPLYLDGGVAPGDIDNLVEHGVDRGFLERRLGDPRETWSHMEDADGQDNGKFLIDAIKAAGYDGISMQEVDPDSGETKDVWVAFEPTQIKSATGNVGSFDPKNPDIRFANRSSRPWILDRDDLGRFRFAAGARAYRLAADIANAVLDKVKMKPISSELGRAMRRMHVEVSKAKELTADVATKLNTLSPEERELISDVIENELRVGITPTQKVLAIAANMQHIMSEQTRQLVDLGMLSQDAASRWEGKYLPRFYQKQFKDELKAWARAARQLFGRKGAMQGIAGNSLKSRGLFKDIPVEELPAYEQNGWEVRDSKFNSASSDQVTVWRDFTKEERMKMGEIRDSMFRFVMGYMRSQKDIALGRLYKHIADTMASHGPKEGYVQVPDTSIEGTSAKRYGKLAGQWVPEEVMDHLAAADSSETNEIFKVYLKGLSLWKEGRTVLNPVSHVNNIVGNVTMAHLAGVSYWDAHKYAAATRDFMKGSKMLTEAKEAGLFGGTFNQADLLNNMPEQLKVLAGMSESAVKKNAGRVWNALSFWLRKPMQKAYEGEDLFFRYLIYRDARKRGVDPDAAVDYAQQYIFNYDDLPTGARFLRNTALPFFSWTYKAVPAMVRSTLEYPWRMAAPAAILTAANQAAYMIAASIDGGDDDSLWEILLRYFRDSEFREQVRAMEAGEREDLPPWLQGKTSIYTPKVIRMGTDDVTGMPMFLDVSRLMPGGDMLDTESNVPGGMPLPQPITPGGPAISVLSGMLLNFDPFFARPIVERGDDSAEAAEKRISWMYQALAPSIAPGGYHFNRAMNAVAHALDTPIRIGPVEYTGTGKDGLPVQPGLAAAQTFGIKLRPIDLDESRRYRENDTRRTINNIKADTARAKRLRNKGAMSDDRYQEKKEHNDEKVRFLKEGLTVDGNEE